MRVTGAPLVDEFGNYLHYLDKYDIYGKCINYICVENPRFTMKAMLYVKKTFLEVLKCYVFYNQSQTLVRH